jgi:alpha-tubulin suppressor-like RCC1 family protein
MNKRYAIAVFFFCLVSLVLPAANLIDLATRENLIGSDAFTQAGNHIYLAQSPDNIMLAYQGNDGKMYFSYSSDNTSWTTTALDSSIHGSLQGLAASASLVVIGYADSGQLFTVSSTDGGLTFSTPVAVISSRQSASIQDMAIDEHDGIHLLFHRHDGYWDYNHAVSTDGGRSYQTTFDFTRMYDSNSTGYSGNLQAIHDNLYTIYQDNNDEYAVKLGVSHNGGDSWTITRIAPSSGGQLALAVDPMDPDLVYMAAFTYDGLTILRIEDATTSSPNFMPVYGDGNLIPSRNAMVSVHLSIADDGTIIAIYLNPITGSYNLLSSTDNGSSWERSLLTSILEPTSYRWDADILSVRNEFLFARHDGNGSIIVHGPAIHGQIYTPDPIGLVDLADIGEPFGVVLNTAMPMVLFSVPENGEYKITHLTQDTIPLYLSVYDLDASAEDVLAENFDGTSLYDHLTITLQEGATYLLALGILDDMSLGMTAHFSIAHNDVLIAPKVETLPSLPTQQVTHDRVSAGKFNSFIIGSSGMIFATGLNAWGQFADGETDYKKTFTPIRSKISDVISGMGHTLYIADDQILYTSGRNNDGQIGDGTKQDRFSLYRLADNVISAAAGYGHTLFVQSDGSVWALGLNNYGQLGNGNTNSQMKPVKIFEGGAKVFSNMRNSSFLVTSDGALYGFGENQDGQLGLGQQAKVLQPTFIMDDVHMVASGSSHTLVLRTDGTVMATGSNSQGQLGNGTTNPRNTFTTVATGVTDIATCDYTSFLIMRDGTLKAAGSNKFGQFGTDNNQTMVSSADFVPVFTDVVDVAGGKDHAVVLKTDGTVWTAGMNDNYQLGDMTQGHRPFWRQVFSF